MLDRTLSDIFVSSVKLRVSGITPSAVEFIQQRLNCVCLRWSVQCGEASHGIQFKNDNSSFAPAGHGLPHPILIPVGTDASVGTWNNEQWNIETPDSLAGTILAYGQRPV